MLIMAQNYFERILPWIRIFLMKVFNVGMNHFTPYHMIIAEYSDICRFHVEGLVLVHWAVAVLIFSSSH